MKNVLVVLAHSNYSNSLSNKTIIDKISGKAGITVRNLDDVSENFVFDVEAEQAALAAADVVVLQFPFHWYSVPAIMKKWLDDVFTFGFAYGPGGDKLAGKKLLLSLTTGGPKEAYIESTGVTIEKLTAPLQQSAVFCSMEFAGTVSTSGQLYIPGMMGDKDEVAGRAAEHSEKLLETLETL